MTRTSRTRTYTTIHDHSLTDPTAAGVHVNIAQPPNGPFRKLSRAMLVTSFGGQCRKKIAMNVKIEGSKEGLMKVHVAASMKTRNSPFFTHNLSSK